MNRAGKGAYPISSFTYLLVYETQTNPAKGKKLVDFIKWAITDGEKDAEGLDYAPLPGNVVSMIEKRLATIKGIAKSPRTVILVNYRSHRAGANAGSVI